MFFIGAILLVLGLIIGGNIAGTGGFGKWWHTVIYFTICLSVGVGMIVWDVTSPVETSLNYTQKTNRIPKDFISDETINFEIEKIEGDYFYTKDIYYLDNYIVDAIRFGAMKDDTLFYKVREIE